MAEGEKGAAQGRSSASPSTRSPRARYSRRWRSRASSISASDRCLSARAARSIIWSASRCRRCCGASCRVPKAPGRVQSVALRLIVRARARDRGAYRAANTGRSRPRCWPPAATAFPARLSVFDGQEARPLRHRRRSARAERPRPMSKPAHFTRAGRRDQAGDAQPLSAVHHLDPAAGSGAQAGLYRQPHDAGGAGPV